MNNKPNEKDPQIDDLIDKILDWVDELCNEKSMDDEDMETMELFKDEILSIYRKNKKRESDESIDTMDPNITEEDVESISMVKLKLDYKNKKTAEDLLSVQHQKLNTLLLDVKTIFDKIKSLKRKGLPFDNLSLASHLNITLTTIPTMTIPKTTTTPTPPPIPKPKPIISFSTRTAIPTPTLTLITTIQPTTTPTITTTTTIQPTTTKKAATLTTSSTTTTKSTKIPVATTNPTTNSNSHVFKKNQSLLQNFISIQKYLKEENYYLDNIDENYKF